MNNNNQRNGIGFLGLLTILFIGLKLTETIKWSWWYVLMPIYLPISIGLIMLILLLVRYVYKTRKKPSNSKPIENVSKQEFEKSKFMQRIE